MKWGQIHPEPDRYNFRGADAIVELAEANPDYVNETASPEALPTLMSDHIQAVMTRYRGVLDRWDVVNEPLTLFGEAGDTDGLRESTVTSKAVSASRPTRHNISYRAIGRLR